MRDICHVEHIGFDYEQKKYYTLPRKAWERPDILLIATGSLACVRTLFFSALRQGKLHQFMPCLISRTEYAGGKAPGILLEALRKASVISGVAGVVVYVSCPDILTRLDLDPQAEETIVPFVLLLRGPLVARTRSAEVELDTFLASVPDSGRRIAQKNLCMPPLSPDFSGIASLLQNWDVYPFLLTAGGCTGCITIADYYQQPYRLDHSRFSDLELAQGCEELAAKGIQTGFEASGKSLCCVVGSAIPALLGMDTEHIVDSVRRAGLPSVYLAADGFSSAQVGIANAMLELGRAILQRATARVNRVNILGYSDLAFGSRKILEPGISALASNGLTAHVWGSLGMNEARSATESALNWIVSAEGLPVAAYMKEQFGVPYTVSLPFGDYGVRRWLDEVGDILGVKMNFRGVSRPNPIDDNRRVLIIGQPVFAESFREFLISECGFSGVQCAAYAPYREMRRLFGYFESIRLFSSMDELSAAVETPDLIMADPLLHGALGETFPLASLCALADPSLSGGHYL